MVTRKRDNLKRCVVNPTPEVGAKLTGLLQEAQTNPDAEHDARAIVRLVARRRPCFIVGGTDRNVILGMSGSRRRFVFDRGSITVRRSS